MQKEAAEISTEELNQITSIYKQLSEPKRNILVMSGNLLLASQNAESPNAENGAREAG